MRSDHLWTVSSSEETFSSPRLADLNQDGVLDVVLGFGQDSFGARQSSVAAFDGLDGSELWRTSGHEDLVGSATFADLDDVPGPDVVIGGRRGGLLALNGATGAVLWEFDDQGGRWFNFYTSQVIEDVNNDGVLDILSVNGGLVVDQPEEGQGLLPAVEDRAVGQVLVVSGADGSVIESTSVPDNRETYMSAVVIEGADESSPRVIIGTGGETLPGSLWAVPLDDIVAGRRLDPALLVSGGAKGLIAAPSLGDLTGDCAADIVAVSFDGTVTAVDGLSGREVWAVAHDGFETYSSPTLGYFTGDDQVPDVFVGLAKGSWPEYEFSAYELIDGATGNRVWSVESGTFAPSGFVAVDIDGDAIDEVIFGVNDIATNSHQLHVLDTTSLTLSSLGRAGPETSFSSPWTGDIDGDGTLDLIVVSSAYHQRGTTTITRLALPGAAPENVSWGGYLGTDGDGRLVDGC